MGYRSPFKIPNGEIYAPTRAEIYFSLEVRKLGPNDNGVFSTSRLPAGTVIGRDGGIVVSEITDRPDKNHAVLIDDGIWLAPPDYDNMDALCYFNHHCESNIARIGGMVYVTKTEVQAGQELTIDYAPLTSGYAGWNLQCRCGSANCRKLITSFDYQNPAIAEKLWPEWLPFIQKRISQGA